MRIKNKTYDSGEFQFWEFLQMELQKVPLVVKFQARYPVGERPKGELSFFGVSREEDTFELEDNMKFLLPALPRGDSYGFYEHVLEKIAVPSDFEFESDQSAEMGWNQIGKLSYEEGIKFFYHFQTTLLWYGQHVVPREHWDRLVRIWSDDFGDMPFSTFQKIMNFDKGVYHKWTSNGYVDTVLEKAHIVKATSEYAAFASFKKSLPLLAKEYEKLKSEGKINDDEVEILYEEDYLPDYEVLANTKTPPREEIPGAEVAANLERYLLN